MKLPDCSGSDLLHDIKHAHAATEVIMVTAYGSLQSAMDCIRNGAAGFLLKPFNAPELLTISLQTAQKKMRLDRLRPILTDSTTLWGPDPACTESWQALAEGYIAMNRTRLNLPIAEQQSLAIGALVHDLDLISLPDSHVLRAEPDPQVHHPDLGARMGRAMGLSADAVQIIALHHERWDGTGYPFGLQEERTPLLARIAGIAQVFDDLTAVKPERTALSNNDALQQIEQLAGSAFDPTLTELFCHIMREQPPQQ